MKRGLDMDSAQIWTDLSGKLDDWPAGKKTSGQWLMVSRRKLPRKSLFSGLAEMRDVGRR